MRLKTLVLLLGPLVFISTACVSKPASDSVAASALANDSETAGLESQLNSRGPASNDPAQLRFHCRAGNSAAPIVLQKSAAHVYAGSGQVGHLYVEMWRDEGSDDIVVSAGDASTANGDLVKEKHVSVASGSFSVQAPMQDLSVDLTCTSANR